MHIIGVDMVMILLTLAVVGLFIMYQIMQGRRRARESATPVRRRRSRTRKPASPEMIDELRILYEQGKVSERTYYEVLRKLQRSSDS